MSKTTKKIIIITLLIIVLLLTVSAVALGAELMDARPAYGGVFV